MQSGCIWLCSCTSDGGDVQPNTSLLSPVHSFAHDLKIVENIHPWGGSWLTMAAALRSAPPRGIKAGGQPPIFSLNCTSSCIQLQIYNSVYIQLQLHILLRPVFGFNQIHPTKINSNIHCPLFSFIYTIILYSGLNVCLFNS